MSSAYHHPTPHRSCRSPAFRSIQTLLLLFLAGCARQPMLESLDTPVHTPAQIYAWECERNFAFVAHQEGDAIWLFLPGRAVQLPAVESDHGPSYRSADISFNHHNGQATLELSEGRYEHCRNNPQRAAREHAKLNGVDFRATGNSPDWILEITLDGDMQLDTGTDKATYHFTTPEPLILERERKTLYSTQSRTDQIIVELTGNPCRDNNTNEIHEITVHISINDQRLKGCGSALH